MATPQNVVPPSISGSAFVGATFNLDSPGSWNMADPEHWYIWCHNGVPRNDLNAATVVFPEPGRWKLMELCKSISQDFVQGMGAVFSQEIEVLPAE